MKAEWFVSPAALSRARVEQLLSREQLAKKAGVSLRSIETYERREQRVTLDSIQCIAGALGVEVKDIGTLRTAGEQPRGKASLPAPSSAPPPPAPTSFLPPRTQLETLVDLERAAGIAPSFVETPRGRTEVLTVKRLQDVFTAYALHEGERFRVTGKVDGMRGLPPDEAKLLGSRGGVAARFHVVKQIVSGKAEHVVGVTVHSAHKDHTRVLQSGYAGDVTLDLRVVLVPGEPKDDVGFSSFITKITAKRPWTFVVEDVTRAEAAEPAAPVVKVNAKAKQRAR